MPSHTSEIPAAADAANPGTSAAAATGKSSHSTQQCRTPACTGAADPSVPPTARTKPCSSGHSSTPTYRSESHSFHPPSPPSTHQVTVEVAYPHPPRPLSQSIALRSRPASPKQGSHRQSTLGEPTEPSPHHAAVWRDRDARGTPLARIPRQRFCPDTEEVTGLNPVFAHYHLP